MSTKTMVLLTDDLDPEVSADETVRFGLDGTDYEIDLTAEHAGQLRDRLALYVGSARRADAIRPASRATRNRSTRTPSTAASGPSASSETARGEEAGTVAGAAAVDTKAVRQWAKDHGKFVSERGRIALSLLIEFQQAHM